MIDQERDTKDQHFFNPTVVAPKTVLTDKMAMQEADAKVDPISKFITKDQVKTEQ